MKNFNGWKSIYEFCCPVVVIAPVSLLGVIKVFNNFNMCMRKTLYFGIVFLFLILDNLLELLFL